VARVVAEVTKLSEAALLRRGRWRRDQKRSLDGRSGEERQASEVAAERCWCPTGEVSSVGAVSSRMMRCDGNEQRRRERRGEAQEERSERICSAELTRWG